MNNHLERNLKIVVPNGELEVSSNDQNHVHESVSVLNDRHAFIMIGGKASIMNIEKGIDGRRKITFSTVADFKARYKNRNYEVLSFDKSKQFNAATEWLKWPGRREYDDLCFRPGVEVPENFFNLYSGFALEPKQGCWDKMKRHLFKVICNNDEQLYNYLLAYLARLFQYPGGDRPGVALVLLGKQGTGKGAFVRNVGQIFGNHFLHISQQGQVTGRFNSHMIQTILMFVDEGVWGGDKVAEGVLKALITEPTIAIEAKGKDIITVENHVNLIIASNNDWVIPAGLEERRYVVFNVSDEHMQDYSYFDEIEQEMNHGGREAMLYDLLNMDISDVNLRDIPRTNGLLGQIEQSLDSVHKFWVEAIKEGSIPLSLDFITNTEHPAEEREWEGWHAKEYVYQAYVAHCRQLGNRHPSSKGQFYKKIKDICPEFISQRETTEQRRPGYWFPPLEYCRAEFE